MDAIKLQKRWIIFFLLLCINTHNCFGQFTMSAQVPVSGLFTKSQLWNLIIVNPTNKAVNAELLLTMQDPQTRQTLLTAVTGLITIMPGTKIIQYQQIQPVQYNYPGGNIDRNPAGFLPVGTYQVCYELHETEVELAEDCVNIEVEPMSPPLLSSPEDQSITDYLRPSFTWLPPAPGSMFFNLNYSFILSPVLQGQSVTEALQDNLPVYSVSNLSQNFLQYPSGIPALDSGKTYTWQIIAKDQTRYAAKSEVWSFTCKKDSLAIIVTNAPYIKITNQPSAPSFAQQGVLKAEYYHETNDSSIQVSINNIKNPHTALAVFKMKVKYGQNFLVYDLNRKMHLQENECYEARFSNKQGDYLMRFYPKYYKQ